MKSTKCLTCGGTSWLDDGFGDEYKCPDCSTEPDPDDVDPLDIIKIKEEEENEI